MLTQSDLFLAAAGFLSGLIKTGVGVGSGLVLLPTLSENVINWIAIIDGIFLLIAFLDYGVAYCCRPSCFVYFDKENQENTKQ